MFQQSLAAILLLAVASVGAAEQLPDYCSRADVLSISIPLFPNKGNSAKFTYRYQFITDGDRSLPVIIYLPGGPGMTGINGSPESPFNVLPMSLGNIIYTDQRTVGCNAGDEKMFPDESLKAAYFAEDVISLIREVTQQGYKYILYGHSFGTLHATLVVDGINRHRSHGDLIPLPEVLVLEGTMGRGFQRGESLKSYQDEWNKVKNRLSPEAQAFIKKDISIPGVPASNWGSFIMNQLYLGQLPAWFGTPDLSGWIEKMAAKDSRAIDMIENSEWGGFGRSFTKIFCQEMGKDFFAVPVLQKGEFEAQGNLCENSVFQNSYDVSKLNLNVPVVYFAGTNDAATPFWQMRYHADHQPRDQCQTVVVTGAGHMPLQTSLFTCKQKLWESIRTHGRLSQEDLAQCRWDYGITLGN